MDNMNTGVKFYSDVRDEDIGVMIYCLDVLV